MRASVRDAGELHEPAIPTLLLLVLAALGSLTVDLYLPALPDIQRDLGSSAAASQLTLTATTVGLAAGQLFIGSWSDSAGRRQPLLVATALHVAASVGVATSTDISSVLAFRFLQGAGAAGSSVAATAIVRDVLHGSRFVQMLARLAIVSGLTPVVAPMLGSLLLRLVGWRGIFAVVATYGLFAVLLTVALLRETLPAERRLPLQVRALGARYAVLVRDREFVGIALVGGLIVSGVFTQMTSSSFLLQGKFGLDAQGYAAAFAVNAVAFVLGTQTSARVIRRLSPHTILPASLGALAVFGFAIAPAGALGLRPLLITTALFMLAAGLSAPCLQVIGMEGQGHQAGTAAAVLGASNFALAGVTSPIVGAIGVDSATPMGVLMGATEAAALVVFLVLVRPRRAVRVGNP